MNLSLLVLCLFIAGASSYILADGDDFNNTAHIGLVDGPAPLVMPMNDDVASNVMHIGVVAAPVPLVAPMGDDVDGGMAMDSHGGMFSSSAAMNVVKTCYGPLVSLWANMSEEQRNTTRQLLEEFKFDEAKSELESVIATLPADEQNVTREWFEEHSPPPALTALFANLTDAERAQLNASKEAGASGIVTMISLFKPHLDNMSAEDRESITDYVKQQLQCITGSFMHAQSGMGCGSGFSMRGGQWPMVKPAVGGPAVNIMPYNVNGGGSNMMMHPMMSIPNMPNMQTPVVSNPIMIPANEGAQTYTNFAAPSSNVNAGIVNDPLVRPMNPPMQSADTNSQPMIAAQQIGGRSGARVLSHRRRK